MMLMMLMMLMTSMTQVGMDHFSFVILDDPRKFMSFFYRFRADLFWAGSRTPKELAPLFRCEAGPNKSSTAPSSVVSNSVWK
jgi:hypothetical protein